MKIIRLSRSWGVRCIDSSGRWSLHCWRGNLRRPVRDVQGCSATSLALMREGFPPSQRIGGGPKQRGCQAPIHSATPSANQMEMAEGGLFPEEKARFADGERQLAERGPMGQPHCALRYAYDSGTNRPR